MSVAWVYLDTVWFFILVCFSRSRLTRWHDWSALLRLDTY